MINRRSHRRWVSRKENKRPAQGSVKFRIQFVIRPICRPASFRGVPVGVPRGCPLTPTPNADMINRRNHRGWATQKENRKGGPVTRKIPYSSRNFPILPFRGVPGEVPKGLPLTPNSQRGAPNADLINKRNHRGWRRREKTVRLIQESVEFRMLFVISQFYRSVGFRGDPWGSVCFRVGLFCPFPPLCRPSIPYSPFFHHYQMKGAPKPAALAVLAGSSSA